MSRSATATAVLLLAVAACGDTPTRSIPGRPGVTFISGHTGQDTVDARLPDLVVEVRGPDGEVATAVEVRFRAEDYGAVGMVAESGWLRNDVTVLTGTDGRAQVPVKLGTRPGQARLVVSAAALGFQDTARYTVDAGAAAKLVLAPRDSMVYAGNTYPVSGAVRDRHGNPRSGAVSFSPGNSRVSFADGRVRGESVGRGYLVARSGGAEDTLWVSVVPRAVLTGFAQYADMPAGMVTFNADGSDYRAVRAGTGSTAPVVVGRFPTWSADGAEILYLSGGRIMGINGAGDVRLVLDGAGMIDSYEPLQVSADGWVYFTRNSGGQRTFWRVRPDGTGAVQASSKLDWGVESWPSPSPSGGHVVYQTNRLTNSWEFTLRTLDTATGAVTMLDVPGNTPRWSPAGEWIAFRVNDASNELRLMRPDGTGVRPVGANIGAHPVFSWSPDGTWLAISGNQKPRPGYSLVVGVSLVNVATGEQLPLTLRQEVVEPAWKP